MDIDIHAIVSNWRALDAIAAGARTGAALKANAYGLGVDRVAPALSRAGCRDFFVATLSEAEELREYLAPHAPSWSDPRRIYVLNCFAPDATGVAACDQPGPRILPVTNSLKSWRSWSEFWRLGHGDRQPMAALQIDSGMNRLGFAPNELDAIVDGDFPRQGALLILSHLASADEPENPQTESQKEVFDHALTHLRRKFPQLEASLAATGGVLRDPGLHYDLTRPGVGLYGGAPFDAATPVVEFSAPILRVWDAEAGAKVGYGGTWTAVAPTRLATVAAGYADGLPRALSNNGVAYINGAPAPIVGRISMDLTVLDVSNPRHAAQIGGRAYFLAHGPNAPPELSIDSIAARTGTIGYEILTKLGAAPRVLRRYRGA